MCRSRRELSNEYLLAKIGVHTSVARAYLGLFSFLFLREGLIDLACLLASIQPRTSPSKFGGKFNSIFIRLLRWDATLEPFRFPRLPICFGQEDAHFFPIGRLILLDPDNLRVSQCMLGMPCTLTVTGSGLQPTDRVSAHLAQVN